MINVKFRVLFLLTTINPKPKTMVILQTPMQISSKKTFLLGRLKTLESLDFREKHAACKGDNIMFREDVGNVYMIGYVG